jgi:hypothetical protein
MSRVAVVIYKVDVPFRSATTVSEVEAVSPETSGATSSHRVAYFLARCVYQSMLLNGNAPVTPREPGDMRCHWLRKIGGAFGRSVLKVTIASSDPGGHRSSAGAWARSQGQLTSGVPSLAASAAKVGSVHFRGFSETGFRHPRVKEKPVTNMPHAAACAD